MIQRVTGKGTELQEARAIKRSARSMGMYVLAKRGHGKSRLLGRKIALEDFLAGIPQVVIDPIGATIDNFLDAVCRFLEPFPPSMRKPTFQRIKYVDMSGKGGYISPFPLYYRLAPEESLLEIAERYLQVIIRSNPALYQAQVLGWPPLHRIGVNSGILLSALGYQITEAEDLLDNPETWEAAGRFAQAEQVSPEAKQVVAYFRNKYIPMRQADRSRLTTPFLDKIFTFPLDPQLKALLGARKPGIDWDEVEGKRQTVLLDFRRVTDAEIRRFLLLWVFDYFYSWVKIRGRRTLPFGLIVDEFAHLTQQVVSGDNPLARELDEFINVYMRQHSIWFTAAHQELYQLDEQLRNTLLSLGTYIFGATSSIDAARELSDAMFFRNPYWVKDYHLVWAREGYPGYISPLDYFVLDIEPQYMPLEEQREILANRIKQLVLFQFLLRPAIAEGDIGKAVQLFSLRTDDRNTETGEYHFPDQKLTARLRSVLEAQSGMPVETILKEQENHLLKTAIRKTLPPAQYGSESKRTSDFQDATRPQQTGDTRHRRTTGQPANDSHAEEAAASDKTPPRTLPAGRQVQRRHRIAKGRG
jgi:hypothetical protein